MLVNIILTIKPLYGHMSIYWGEVLPLFDLIAKYYNDLLELTKHAPVFGGAIMLWLLSTITYLARNVPTRIWDFIVRRMTITLEFTNTGVWLNEANYESFLTWYLKQPHSDLTRSFSLTSAWKPKQGYSTVIGAGMGTMFFIYKGRLFWFKRTREVNNVSDKFKETIVLTGLSRDTSLIIQLTEEFKYKYSENNKQIYTWNVKDWCEGIPIIPRGLKTVAMNSDLKRDILGSIKRFKQNEQWYLDRGIPYKLVILLYGPPGTGKTSLVRSLATETQSDIFRTSMSQLHDGNINLAMSKVTKNSFLLIEDFDSSSALKKRKNIMTSEKPTLAKVEADEKPSMSDEIASAFERLTLSGFLNAIDGIAPLDNTIVIFTTNDISNIDPAVLRSGRIDERFYIGALDDSAIKTYLKEVVDIDVPDTITFKPIVGCDLLDLYRRNNYSKTTFLDSLPKEI